MIKVFDTINDFLSYSASGLKSGELCYVAEDKTAHFRTNNIDGIDKNYDMSEGGGIVPEGNIDLIENGVHDVSSYATASVNVPVGITPTGNYDITENGNYDVSSYATASVNVAGGDNADFIDLIERDITTFNIPSEITKIGNGAFSQCSGLTSITIPDSVTSIGNGAFQYCSELTNVTIGNSMTLIDAYVFDRCSKLTSVTIGNSVTSIGNNAFLSCSSLTSIICNIMTAPTIQNNTFQGVKTGGTLIVPAGSTGYDVWMGTGNYYLGKYNWTKVEQ